MQTRSNAQQIGEDPLGQVDLCFVVDTTGSMGSFLTAARERLAETVAALAAEADVRVRFGLVEFRDHPPQERTFVTRVHPFTDDAEAIRRVLNGLSAVGGGDGPEAVYDGVHDACTKMAWRPHACRFALLVGDAPPHGIRAHEQRGSEGEAAGKGARAARNAGGDYPCPCGLDLHQVAAAAEANGVVLHALCMGAWAETVASFTALATGTGGTCVPSGNAGAVIAAVRRVLAHEFGRLPLDRRALAVVRERAGDCDTRALAEALDVPRAEAAAALARLGRRGLLDAYLPPLTPVAV